MLTFLVNFHGNLRQVILHVWELVKVVCVDKSRAGQVGAHKTEEMCRWLMILPPAKYPSFVISLPQSSSLSCPWGFLDFFLSSFRIKFAFLHFFCSTIVPGVKHSELHYTMVKFNPVSSICWFDRWHFNSWHQNGYQWWYVNWITEDNLHFTLAIGILIQVCKNNLQATTP